jgi:hypothetical protein
MQRLPTTSTTTTDTGLELAKWLGGAAAGALLMYMLDPDRGGARRAQSAAAVRNAGTRTTSAISNVWRGAGDAADDAVEAAKPNGGVASAISRLGRAAGDMLDDTLSKARDTVGRASSAAGDLADDAISKARSDSTYSHARSTVSKAVSHAADSAVDFYDDTRKSAGKLGRRVAQEVRGDSEGAWNPGMRNTALVGGGLLALFGLMRRSGTGRRRPAGAQRRQPAAEQHRAPCYQPRQGHEHGPDHRLREDGPHRRPAGRGLRAVCQLREFPALHVARG